MNLDHLPSRIIAALLIDQEQGSAPADNEAWPIRSTQEVTTPDNLITVYDTEGTLHGRDFVLGEMDEHHGIQIRVRATSQATAWTKANSIASVIDQTILREVVEIGEEYTYYVHSVNRRSGPIYVGKEPGTKRHLVTINALTSIRQLT